MLDNIWFFIAAGFLAQLVDGSLGMAYGVSANSLLLGMGVPPAAASASIHTAETFTTFLSGISHWRFKNIDWSLVKRLLIPGVLGGISGAYLLTQLDGNVIKPYIAGYLLLMGALIIWKSFQTPRPPTKIPLIPLAAVGGFMDAIGGGGWGPIVTSTLMATDHPPRTTIGSVNLTEFFVTFCQAFTFLATIGMQKWQPIVGLIIGGLLAAPLGAFFATRISPKPLMRLVGALIILLSLRTLFL